MGVTFLVTAMKKDAVKLVETMNLNNCNVVVADQCETTNCSLVFTQSGHSITHICTNTKGVSVNRNIGLLYTDDIVVFSDDDQVFVDGSEKLILEEFSKVPNAQAIKFYCQSKNPNRPLAFKKPNRLKKGSLRTLMSAGVPGLAVKKTFLIKNDIRFSEELGPGKYYYCGEDSVFINTMYKKSKNIYVSPVLISEIKQDESSWFEGYTERYLITSGYVYARLYGFLSPVFVIKKAIRLKNKSIEYSLLESIKKMCKGIKQYYS